MHMKKLFNVWKSNVTIFTFSTLNISFTDGRNWGGMIKSFSHCVLNILSLFASLNRISRTYVAKTGTFYDTVELSLNICKEASHLSSHLKIIMEQDYPNRAEKSRNIIKKWWRINAQRSLSYTYLDS